MLDRYGLLGTGSGIAVALYIFSLIQKRTIRVSDPATEIHPIRLPNRGDSAQLLVLVLAAEWGVLAIFVLSEMLHGRVQTWLKLLAISCGGSMAMLYVLCAIRLRRLALMNPSPAKPPHSGSRRFRLRHSRIH
jgi:hypothetical protein